MRERSKVWLPAALLALSTTFCAEGRLTPSSDAGQDQTDVEQTRDLPPDPDVDQEPPPGDPIDDPVADADAMPDVDPLDLAGECQPFSATCTADTYAIQRCSATGELFDPAPCAIDEVCEASGGAVQCVACTEGVNCRPPEATCEADTVFCVDFETAARCGSDGQIATETGCGLGRCFGGGCNTTGNDTGEACSQDSGCVGRTCLCGAEDTANQGSALCAGNLAAGYCTTSACDVNSCDFDAEVCVDFELSGAFGSRHMCLLREDCSTRLGSCRAGHRGDDHACRSLPTTSSDDLRRSWELACWVPAPSNPDSACADTDCLSPIGTACASDDDCVGGLCMTLRDGIRYCSAPCDETLECPSYAACVRLQPDSDSHFCLARAQAADCPRMTQNFEIVSRSFPRVGGVTTAQVCFVSE